MMKNYLEKVYSGWLAKLAGIRLGAPIEGWTYERILAEKGEIDGYLKDMRNFRPDDDSNGPIMFIRAMNDTGLDPSSNDIARAWLDYAPYQHGFFWWGGYGVSTEHTAYMNLVNGIPAPRSGSIEQNGAQVAEQIGGQIFIDLWGLVCPNNPAKAAELAERAAKVSHDGDGAYGGMYVAACEAAAFGGGTVREMMETGLSFIPAESGYARVVRAVMKYYDENHGSWRDCFKFVHDNYGYDKYPGNCHIIPNAAVMALALLYGEGDFDRTLNICNMCGWDTDCNVGNVACMLGVLLGLDAIDYDKWLKPINDGFAVSCAIGCLGWLDVPWCARYIADIGIRLAGEDAPDWHLNEKIFDFALPNSTHSFESETAELKNIGGKLAVNGKGEVYRATFYTADDFSDKGYLGEIAPQIYPNQRVTAKIEGRARLFADTLDGKRILGEIGEGEISLDIPRMENAVIRKVGIICEDDICIDEMRYVGRPDYALDMRSTEQFNTWKGIFHAEENGTHMSCDDEAASTTGDIEWKNYAIDAVLTPRAHGEYSVIVLLEGMTRCAEVTLGGGHIAVVEKDRERKIIAKTAHECEIGKKYAIRVECVGNEITVKENGAELLRACVNKNGKGCAGFGVRNGGAMLISGFAVSPIE